MPSHRRTGARSAPRRHTLLVSFCHAIGAPPHTARALFEALQRPRQLDSKRNFSSKKVAVQWCPTHGDDRQRNTPLRKGDEKPKLCVNPFRRAHILIASPRRDPFHLPRHARRAMVGLTQAQRRACGSPRRNLRARNYMPHTARARGLGGPRRLQLPPSTGRTAREREINARTARKLTVTRSGSHRKTDTLE